MGESILMWYKKFGSLLKFLLLPLAIVGCALWLVGNLAHFRTLVMFMFGVCCGLVLYFFVGNQVVEWFKSITIIFG